MLLIQITDQLDTDIRAWCSEYLDRNGTKFDNMDSGDQWEFVEPFKEAAFELIKQGVTKLVMRPKYVRLDKKYEDFKLKPEHFEFIFENPFGADFPIKFEK